MIPVELESPNDQPDKLVDVLTVVDPPLYALGLKLSKSPLK